MASRRNLLAERQEVAASQQSLQNKLDEVDSRLATAADRSAHELERLFRANSAAADAAASSDGSDTTYPHVAGKTLCVRPNACNSYGWLWEATDDDGTPLTKKRKKAPAKAPAGQQKKGRAKAASSSQAASGEAASDASYGSVMEAYEAAAPGSVIKLLAGRHLLTEFNKHGDRVWKGLMYRKSVQIVAADGLSREQVLVGTDPGESCVEDGVILISGADLRFERITFLVTSSFS